MLAAGASRATRADKPVSELSGAPAGPSENSALSDQRAGNRSAAVHIERHAMPLTGPCRCLSQPGGSYR